ncbi:hypothetical protein MMC13_001732 [Lambiella insularis]|nr:hypothetical protein [Lambiella insularis]
MAPQTTIPVAANVLGTIGTVCWSIQLIPQIWTNWKSKSTEGLPGATMLLWAISAVPFGTYAIVQNFNIPIQIQPHIFCALAMVNWAQILIYNNAWRIWTASLLSFGITALFAGLEAILIVTLRGPTIAGDTNPMTVVGIIASILVAAGLIPPYYEIWKRKGQVVGFNFLFLTVDISGATFSLMALLVQHSFDILGGVLYIICLVLEGGIFLSHGIWLLRTRRNRKSDAESKYVSDVISDSLVQVISRSEYKAAAACLAAAFSADDVSAYFTDCPDTASWTPEARWALHVHIMEYMVYAHMINGFVVGVPSDNEKGLRYDAVALWCPPGTNIDSTYTELRSGMWRLRYQLSKEGKARFFDEFMPLLHATKGEVLAERDDQSWYLVYLGTRDAARGKGYARQLMEWGTKQADRMRMPTYLESSNELNPLIYGKWGFRMSRRIVCTRAAKRVPLDIMIREPLESTV